MKIIGVDNFDRETVSDVLVEENLTAEGGRMRVDELNKDGGNDNPYFYKLVADDHVLYVFDPT